LSIVLSCISLENLAYAEGLSKKKALLIANDKYNHFIRSIAFLSQNNQPSYLYIFSLLGILFGRFLPKGIWIECIAYSFIFQMLFYI
jgi:hypothetical protein